MEVTRLVASARRLRSVGDVRLALQVYRAVSAAADQPPIRAMPTPPPHPVVFVRGLGMTMIDSHSFASALAIARGGGAVVTFDHVGFGDSSVPQPSWGEGSIAGMALDCLDVADCASAALEAASFSLFGVSMGGYIAMSAALARQRQTAAKQRSSSAAVPSLRALVVGCSHHGGPQMEPITSSYVERLRHLELHQSGSPAWRRAVSDLYALNFSPEFRATSQRFAGLLRAFEESCLRDTRAGLAYQNTAVSRFYRDGMREELRSELGGPQRLPTLVITGDADEIVPARNSELLAEAMPHAMLELLPGVGHMFFEESTQRTVDIVAAFLREHDADDCHGDDAHGDGEEGKRDESVSSSCSASTSQSPTPRPPPPPPRQSL